MTFSDFLKWFDYALRLESDLITDLIKIEFRVCLICQYFIYNQSNCSKVRVLFDLPQFCCIRFRSI